MNDTAKTLGDVCEFIVDCLHTTALDQGKGYPLIRTPNVGKGRLKLDGVHRVSEDIYQERIRRAVPEKDDLILAREAPAGNIAILKNEHQVCLGQRTVHMRADKAQVDPDYLCYYMLAPQQQGVLLAGETGVTSKHVNMKDIRQLPLKKLPHIKVQREVGRLLSTYDDLIENNQRRIQLLEQSAGLLYKEWFVHLRFPGHEHTAITNGVPEGWERKKLSDVANITMGQSPKSIYYNEDGIGLPFHQGVTNFGNRFPLHKTYCTMKNRLAGSGDILFSVRAPVGKINITPDEIIIGRGISAIRSRCGQQNFLFYALKCRFFKEDMIGTGAIFAAVTRPDLHNIELVQPLNRIAQMFAECVKPIDHQIANLHHTTNSLAQARDLLLPQLMCGKVST